LEYMLGAFHSLSLRIHSVETRVKNVINLVSNNHQVHDHALTGLQAFNLVVQRDSTLLQKDSQSMKTIAVMTLIFLPGTAVAVSVVLSSSRNLLIFDSQCLVLNSSPQISQMAGLGS
jgi:hypothetical protein